MTLHMRRLWLMRHGEAGFSARDDFSRELTPAGVLEVQESLGALSATGSGVRHILASPLVRAQQTAAVAAGCFNIPVSTHPQLTPQSDARVFFDWAWRNDLSDCLIVSHMPFIGELFSMAVEGSCRYSMSFHTGQIVCIAADVFGPGCFSLVEEHAGYKKSDRSW